MTVSSRRAITRGAAALCAVALLAAGCLADGSVRGPSSREDSTSDSSDEEASTDAAEVLARYGITLHAVASAPEMELLPENEGREEGYRLTFTTSEDEAEQLCADINGPLPALRLTETEVEVFGIEEPPEGARLCSGSRPKHNRQQIRLLYVGDPAEVTLALYLMPVR